MTTDGIRLPIKVQTIIEKHHGEIDPNDPTAEPYETVESVGWYEADGTMISDPARIAELEERISNGTD